MEKERALLVDDWKRPDRFVFEDDYAWTVARTNDAALAAVLASRRFDVWFMDLSLDYFGSTAMPMMRTVLADHPHLWPNRITVVSDSPQWRWFTDEIKTMNPATTVTYYLKGYVSEGHEPEVAPEAIKTFLFVAPPKNDLAARAAEVLRGPKPSPWHDANKGKPTIRFKTKKKGR